MSKDVRVLSIANEIKLDVNDVILRMQEMGIDVKTKYSSVTGEQAERFKDEMERLERQRIRETRMGGGALVRKKVEKPGGVATRKRVVAPPKDADGAEKPAARRTVARKVAAAVTQTEEPAEAPVARKRVAVRKKDVAPEAVVEEPVAVEPTLPEETPVEPAAEAPVEAPVETAPQLRTEAVEQPEAPVEVQQPVEAAPVPTEEAPQDVAAAPAPEVAQSVPAPAAPEPAEEAAVEAEEDKSPKHRVPHHSPLPGKPEASASPGSSLTGGKPIHKGGRKIEYSGPQLGPTGRFIVLPKAAKVNAGRPAAPGERTEDSSGSSEAGKARGKGERVPGASYRERYKEDELLRKAGPNKRKKSKPVRPAAPPEGRRKIKVDEFISVSELAKQMGMKAGELIKKLLSLGQMVNINSTLDVETADIVASEWGYEIESIGFKEDIALGDDEPIDEERLVSRPPIVTIMGHVDHGKTSLLDVIRKSDIVSTESGGITQHIGAYKVKTKDGEIVFIDTPGHEAFSHMRARGASVTDVVILVVAADDGVMPQTVEAINHCKDAKVPIIVAVTKVDKNNANPQMVREKLTAHNLVDEKWGGDTIMVDVSAVNKTGVDTLLEMVVLQSELLDLRADPDGPCKGVVLEAELNKARGPVINILTLSGKLNVSDFVIAGTTGGKIRAMINDRGKPVKEAGPATPIEVTGLDGVPAPGDDFRSVTDEKTARRILDRRRDEAKARDLARKSQAKGMEAIRLAIAKGQQEQLNIVLKSDVQGTMEAIKEALVRLSTEKVKVNVVNAAVGGINESDVNLAITAEAVVMGFRVRPASKARHLAEKSGVEVRQYNVIYDMVDDVKDLMRGLLPKEKKERFLGKIEVRAVFTIPKIGSIAGCYVLEGKVHRNCQLRLFRENVQIYEGKVSSLRRFKEDAREVMQGYECGIGFENYHDIKEGDLLEAYEMIEVQAEL